MANKYLRRLGLILCLCLSSTVFAKESPERKVYWGEQHVHTSWSFDAYAFGNTLTGPEDFYQYALGQPIRHPGGFDVQITKPLDWGAVTEHSDYMGLVQLARAPESALSESSGFMSGLLRFAMDTAPLLTFKVLSVALALDYSIDAFTKPSVLAPVWSGVVRAADKYYQPGKFTTFAAFEWTSTPDSNNLHRNVFFLDSEKVPDLPYTTLDSRYPIDLWRWMDAQRAAGNEVLAVSHNGNLSSGRMFPREMNEKGEPLDEQWARARLRNEPLTEIKQSKGQSETTPLLSPNDEFARYEVFDWQMLGAKGKPQDRGSYARQAYLDGLAMGQGKGFNPYQFGIIGGSDSHVTAASYRQDNYFGAHGAVDDTVEERVSGAAVLGLSSLWVSPSGLSAVWAEENTREAIFAGLKRKEAYATSGTRISLRFFGSWEYSKDLPGQADWVNAAYEAGVPMGSELPQWQGGAPNFAIWATRDPDSANLDRIQVIKGWSRDGRSFEKIYDVAWAGERIPDRETGRLPAIGSTVVPDTGEYSNTIGDTELKTVWLDPDFDPHLDAFYYVRVLEIPTPRWSTIQAAQLGRVPPTGKGFTAVVQERAWSSPIWYTASPDAGEEGADPQQAADTGQNSVFSPSDTLM